jgi:hypothetical protein
LASLDFWWPSLRKGWSRFNRAARERARETTEYLRELVDQILRKPKSVTASAGLPVEGTITPTGEVTLERQKSLASMVVRRLYEVEARLKAVEEQREEGAKLLETRLRLLLDDVQEMIRRSKDQYLGARIVGLAFAFAGSVVLAMANLAPS